MTASGISFNPPRGMRDFYPDEMAARTALFRAWTEAAQCHGFAQYDACVVESLDLLKRKSGEEIVDQIYDFKDKSGRDLALRPEMTPSLARMVAARHSALAFPIKWFTIAQCFRYERMTKGRKREHYQWNLDIIGESSVAAEAEVLATAAAAMRRLGLQESHYGIRISNRALLTDLLERSGLPKDHHAAAFLALDKRGKIDDAAIAALLVKEGMDPPSVATVFDILQTRTLEDVERLLGASTPALDNTRALFALLETYGLANVISFDLSVIRGLAYYTGVVFEAFDTAGESRAIFGGGRYDNLLGMIGGKPTTGVGLGFGDVVIADLMAEVGAAPAAVAHPVTAIGFMDSAQQRTAVCIASALRLQGACVELGLAPEKPKPFFSRCGKGTFARAVYIGPDDMEKGTVRVKDLAARSEEEVAIDVLLG